MLYLLWLQENERICIDFFDHKSLTVKIKVVKNSTGWSILFCLILSGSYDNIRILMKKIMVDLFSGYPDISFDNKKSEKNNRHFIS